MSVSTSSATNTMSTAAKTSKKSTKTETVVAPIVAPVVAAVVAPVAVKASKKAASAVVAPAVAAPVASSAVVVDAVAATPATVAEEDLGVSLQKSIATLQENLNSLKAAASAAASALKTIEKQAARLAKRADRRRKRSSAKIEGAEPKPCIFTKPVKITDELCAFLGNPKGTEISRSAVTKGVMAYAKSHNLMEKQTIKADAALRKLLTLSETDTLTILNLQKFLGRHYIKAVPVAA